MYDRSGQFIRKDTFRTLLADRIELLLRDHAEMNGSKYYWRRPLVGFADVEIAYLKDIISDDHYSADDVLPGARTIITYFLPFREEVGDGNVQGAAPSDEWVDSYRNTNAAAVMINEHLCRLIREMGSNADVPENAGMNEHLMSRWSQRHIARHAGLGTFGMNNMLITEAGCCGRFFSIVTDIPIEPDVRMERENCLFKRNGTCGECMERCIPKALGTDGFNRFECHKWMTTVPKRDHGLDVCGKCVSGIPCAYRSL